VNRRRVRHVVLDLRRLREVCHKCDFSDEAATWEVTLGQLHTLLVISAFGFLREMKFEDHVDCIELVLRYVALTLSKDATVIMYDDEHIHAIDLIPTVLPNRFVLTEILTGDYIFGRGWLDPQCDLSDGDVPSLSERPC
jgi:hypothetical protein